MRAVDLALYVLGALALAAGVAGTVLPALPGAPLLVVGAVLVAWAGDFQRVGWPSLAAIAVLAALTLAVEWVAALLGARRFGASRWAFVGASIGLVVGLFLGLPGVLLGPIVGAVALEYAKNADLARAGRAGAGVALGMLVGGAVKVALALAAVGVLAVALVV
jgi:uncharacterized protein YqgC (DUF456 family)